jgi:hypothetical protein
MGRQLHFALQPFNHAKACRFPLAAAMHSMGREGKHPLKYKTQSVVPAIWLVRRFFLFVWVLFVEKLGVLMTDKGGFL